MKLIKQSGKQCEIGLPEQLASLEGILSVPKRVLPLQEMRTEFCEAKKVGVFGGQKRSEVIASHKQTGATELLSI